MKLILLLLFIWLMMYFLRNKFTQFKKPGFYLLLPLLLAAIISAPLVFFIVLMGLSGSDKENFILIAVSYICILIFSIISFKKIKFIIGALLGVFILCFGIYKDSQFWKNHNDNLCLQIRADPYCIETKTGFNCSQKSSLGGFTSGNICSSKLTDNQLDKINSEKRNRQIQIAQSQGTKPDKKIPNLNKVSRATKVYDTIVKKIISSPNPTELNFENQMTSIYNCINSEFENELKAESYATMHLQELAKTKEDFEKYRAYSASKGRMITQNLKIAALPSGDKKLNCSTLNE